MQRDLDKFSKIQIFLTPHYIISINIRTGNRRILNRIQIAGGAAAPAAPVQNTGKISKILSSGFLQNPFEFHKIGKSLQSEGYVRVGPLNPDPAFFFRDG